MDEEDDYKVGYGRPPRANQYKKGQSGNPSGRPHGGRNVMTILAEELSAEVMLRDRGTPISVTMQQVIIKKMIAQAAQGDHKARSQLLGIQREGGAFTDKDAAQYVMDSADKEALTAFIEDFTREGSSRDGG